MIVSLFLIAASLPSIVNEAPAGAVKLLRPGTRSGQVQDASSSRAPWVDANGWRYRRSAHPQFLYDGVPAKWLPLAAAEAFVYGGPAVIRTDAEGRAALDPMMQFLKGIDGKPLKPVADIFVYDDGSPALGEVLNLLSRRNLAFETGAQPEGNYKLVVKVGTPEFPQADTANPSQFAYLVRKKLGDAKRSLRIFGSEIIIGYLTAEGGQARLHLLNYGTDPIESFRVRVLGNWKVAGIRSFQDGALKADEEAIVDGGVEFGVPKITTYAVVDLTRK